jgi:hypothetical protein
MMTREQKIRAKVGLLELAKQLGNVSQACKMLGYSRDSFYQGCGEGAAAEKDERRAQGGRVDDGGADAGGGGFGRR